MTSINTMEGFDVVINENKLIKDLEKAINGEYSAISCYKQLAELAPMADEMQRVREIRQDEINHFQEFSQIYTSLTGKQPTPQITEECPSDYKEGLVAAFQDEQETVDFYLDIADQAEDAKIKETFRRAAADEQNHAVWFLYYMNGSGRSKRIRQNDESYGAKGALGTTDLTFPEALTYAMQDEYLAQARYDDIISKFGEVRTFTRIKQAELRHIEALKTLFARYQIQVPEDDAEQYVTSPATLKDAYKAGVEGEVDNISMYDQFLSYQVPEDARIVFTQLRNASVNHLTAFRRGLARGLS